MFPETLRRRRGRAAISTNGPLCESIPDGPQRSIGLIDHEALYLISRKSALASGGQAITSSDRPFDERPQDTEHLLGAAVTVAEASPLACGAVLRSAR